MARKLPWERKESQKRVSASAHRRSISPAGAGPSRRDDDIGDDARDSGRKRQKYAGPPSISGSATRFRTPSTSPPPAPPSEAFMIEGLAHDDGYRMVEDELLAVAQTFTAHLHAAEYQRLKAKAKQQAKASGGSNLLPRPVTIAPTDRVTKRNAMTKRQMRQNTAVRKAASKGEKSDSDTESDAEAPWAGTSLQNLMDGSPRKAKPTLVSLDSFTKQKQGPLRMQKNRQSEMCRLKYRPLAGSSPLKTVASIGMSAGETASEAEDDDDDDLDGPSTEATQRSKRNGPSSGRSETYRPGPSRIAQTTPIKRTVTFASKASEIPPSNPGPAQHEDVDDDDDISDLDGGSLMDKIRRRRDQEKADKQRRLQQQREARGG